MKSSSLLARTVIAAALAFSGSAALADQIVNSATGLVDPGVTITFDSPAFEPDTKITNQYANFGVTFDYLYYSPFDDQGPYVAVSGNYLGNFTSGADAAEVRVLTIDFTNLQTRVAFGLVSNGGEDGDGNLFVITALLDGVTVGAPILDSVGNGYYGFTNLSPFNQIVITSSLPFNDAARSDFGFNTAASSDIAIAPSPDFYLFDNLQFDLQAVTPAVVPEPEIAALFGLGLAGAAVMRRRSSRPRAA